MPEPPTQPHTPAGRTVDQSPEEIAALSASAAVPQVSGYEILGELGRGGMGVVYRARHLALDRAVAIKFLRPELARASAARRFREEARVTGQLAHPAIPPVHDFGELPDGRPFLVMKLIKGRTLADLLDENGRDRGALVAAFALVCQGVAYAHARGVIHRDLKPANVMVGAFGEVQVMDWGLAKVLGAPAHDSATEPADDATEIRTGRAGEVTHAGSVMGTPAYMSPEQAGGEVDKIDARSDVFGLGAILCAILTGGPPYAGPTTDSVRLMAVRGETADALARLSACGADPELVALCARCLERDRAARPASGGEVAAAVAAHLANVAERAKRAELERVRAEGLRARSAVEVLEQRKRRRVELAFLLSVGALVAVTATAAWRADSRAREDRYADERRAHEREENLRAEHLRRERNAEALEFLLDLCKESLRAKNFSGARKTFGIVEARLADGRLDDYAQRIEDLRADLVLLERLEGTASERFKHFLYDERSKLNELYSAPFRDFGIVPASMSPDELRARLERSVAPQRVVAALREWQDLTRSGELQQLADRSGLWVVNKGAPRRIEPLRPKNGRSWLTDSVYAPPPGGRLEIDDGFVAPPPRAK
jgi:tRNA A-37 threonylcarbamoyl transferase component Bud32